MIIEFYLKNESIIGWEEYLENTKENMNFIEEFMQEFLLNVEHQFEGVCLY